MKIKKWILGLVLLPAIFSAKGYGYYNNSCCDSYQNACYGDCFNWLSGLSVYGDWLYWRARRSNLDYALPYNPTANTVLGDVYKVEPDYKSGFRFGIVKECDCVNYEFRYTYFHPSWSNSVSGSNITATRTNDFFHAVGPGSVVFAEGKWKLRYDQIDLLAGYHLQMCSCINPRVFGGFTWARVDQEFNSRYIQSSTVFENIDQKLDMDGYGINIGIDTSYPIWGCLNFFGAFWYNALWSDFKSNWKYTNTTPFRGDLRDDYWELISVINLSLGLQYNRPVCFCFLKDVGISVGYEFHHWIEMPDFLAISGSNQQMVLDRRTNLDFDGLFIRVSLGF